MINTCSRCGEMIYRSSPSAPWQSTTGAGGRDRTTCPTSNGPQAPHEVTR